MDRQMQRQQDPTFIQFLLDALRQRSLSPQPPGAMPQDMAQGMGQQLGGMSGEAARALMGRQQQLDQAEQQAITGRSF